MNAYEAKRAARIDRMRARADKRDAEANAAHSAATRLADMIPLGQPILVGHHSERRHRRDAERIRNGFARAFEASTEAQELRRRADAAEESAAVSSDDPDAVAKLRAKLAEAEADHAKILEKNRQARSRGERPEAWEASNSSANIRRIKARIAELEKRAAREPASDEMIGDVRLSESENRVRLVFPGKPSPETIAALKSSGFRWSPSAGAWQRHASIQAWWWAREIARKDQRVTSHD